MAAATVYKSSSYPQVPGAKPQSLFNITGPASYTAVTPGTTPTGGQTLQAKDIGLTNLSTVTCFTDNTGAYGARAIWPVQLTAVPPTANTSVILQWFVLATGAEVAGAVDLSTKTLRALATGNY